MTAPPSVLRATVLSAAPGWHAAADAWVDFCTRTRIRRVALHAFIIREGSCFALTGPRDPPTRHRLTRVAVVTGVVCPGYAIQEANDPVSLNLLPSPMNSPEDANY